MTEAGIEQVIDQRFAWYRLRLLQEEAEPFLLLGLANAGERLVICRPKDLPLRAVREKLRQAILAIDEQMGREDLGRDKRKEPIP